jgi:hypothetical protein
MSRNRNTAPEVNLTELPALPAGWCWTTLSTIAAIEGGITKDQKRQRTATMRDVPYLRVANGRSAWTQHAACTRTWYCGAPSLRTINSGDTPCATRLPSKAPSLAARTWCSRHTPHAARWACQAAGVGNMLGPAVRDAVSAAGKRCWCQYARASALIT